jgi:transposase InsO family protein
VCASGAAGNERSGHARRWLCRRGPNQRWSLDFVSDALASGRRFRVLAVVDDFTRECLGLIAAISLSGLRVGRELDRIAEVRSYPAMVVSDNGTELTEISAAGSSTGIAPFKKHLYRALKFRVPCRRRERRHVVL